MPKPVYKMLLLLKRNPAMSLEEFQEEYESVHAPYCAPLMKGASRYVRRYVTLAGAPHAPDVRELDFDVITEVWFEDRATFEATVSGVAQHKMGADVLPREAKMFDTPSIRVVTAIEFDSDLES